jgi:hypothetical protein
MGAVTYKWVVLSRSAVPIVVFRRQKRAGNDIETPSH